jgi:aerobic carbon-monoxide dehydrogenase large subunit
MSTDPAAPGTQPTAPASTGNGDQPASSTNGAENGHVGRRMRRKEDPPLLQGLGRYLDDITIPGVLHAAFVRSPEAHARIASVDASAALARDGIHAVFTGRDVDLEAGLPLAWLPPGIDVNAPEHWPLAKEVVRHVGDPVAVVIGEDRYAVVDAVEDVIVDYDPLPAVTDVEAALEGGDLVHPDLGTNKVHEWSLGGDVESALEASEIVIERRFVNHRISGAPIETRGVLADYRAGDLTVWSSTQIPNFLRLFLAIQLGMTEDRIRVIAPDVGGGFGSKLQVYGEEILLPWCSRKLGRPVKWVETRSEHMMAAHHGRDQVGYVKMGAKRDGTFTALHVRILQDIGAYSMFLGPMIPSLGSFVMPGCYRWDAVRTDITGVFTNKMATDAIRGAGRPEATQYVEVMVEQMAHELGIDRLELRRRNFVPKEEFPYPTAVGMTYDSGDYQGTLAKLLTHIDPEQERARAEGGKLRGVGFSAWAEICGLAPSRATGPATLGVQAGLWESALVRVQVTGSVTVYSGTSPHGQGLETGFAQIVADRLGVDPEQVRVMHGDTSQGPQGLGTYGSRSMAVGGEAVARATAKVVEKVRAIVAHKLEAAPEDIELREGRFSVRGSPDKGMTLPEVAGLAYIPEGNLPEGMEPGLEETAFFDPDNFTFPFGAHAAVVEVDPETGKIDVVRYVAVDDCGNRINPNLIEGQIHGGIVHAIGQALFEQLSYDENGQLETGSFVSYALPSAAEVPSFETDYTVTPSPTNSLGVKGVGEAGTIAASAAVTNAVIDALRPLGVDFINMPLTSVRVWEAIHERGGAPA